MWRGDRRRFGAALGVSVVATLSSRGASAQPSPDAGLASGDLELRDVALGGVGQRMVLLLPTHLDPAERVPLVVLHHGLGETVDPRTGAYAWVERYGVAQAYERLRRPPVTRTSPRVWTDARLAEVNASLGARPFRGLVIACPFTPNLAAKAIDGYATWLTDVALPRALREAAATCSGEAHIGGCSLGGYLSLEIFLRRPELFTAWGGVQTAIATRAAPAYADRLAHALARVGPRRLHLETSDADPFREANEALAAALRTRQVPRDLRVLPGPHDQPWLREAGTLEALLWHERA